jgi:ectoine hydroxylase
MLSQKPASKRSFGGRLSPEDLAAYERDGFVRLPGFFSVEEIEPLAQACRADPEVEGALLAVADSSGNPQEVTTWTILSDDLVGIMPRVARIVEAAEDLVGGAVYHWHSKLSMKKPGSAGRWDWHQDYGYWYDEGCLRSDMTTCMIAIDATFRENGCVQLVRGSHRLGRIDHKRVGEASGVDPQRLGLILKKFEIVECVMQPGDAIFFHSNTLHASGPNESRSPRTLLHSSYNAVDNEPYVAQGQEHHKYRPLEKLPDSAIREGRYRSIFSNQIFRQPDPDSGINNYGYKMLKYSRRPRSAPKGKDF